jgi:hypothetical protein
MLWIERALAGAGVLRELVWGLSCPVHCGGSGVPLFGFGLLLGFLCGVSLSLAALWTIYHLQIFQVPPASRASDPPSSFPRDSTALRRRTRLQGYLPVDE